METDTSRPWYKKKRYIIPAVALGGLFALSGLGGSEASVAPITAPTPSYEAIQQVNGISSAQADADSNEIKEKPVPSETSSYGSGLSNDNYYTNVDGNEVHSPAYSDTVPAGASARCRDGTYSFSQNRRGTCSHHGGVAQWL